MSLFSQIQEIKAQISDTERILKVVGNHPVMSLSIKEKLEELKQELKKFPEDLIEPKVQLLFSGDAVKGSQGIKAGFISRTVIPFQTIVRNQVSTFRRMHKSEGEKFKKKLNTEFYITGLPIGSFGVELSQLDQNDPASEIEIANAIQMTMELINAASISDELFNKVSENANKQTLSSLKTFLKEVADENSIIKMQSGNLTLQIPKEKVKSAYERVETAFVEEEQEIFEGVLRGFLLDSRRFEIIIEEGKIIRGDIGKHLSEEDIVNLSQQFLNKYCLIEVLAYITTNSSGLVKTTYELLGVKKI